MPLFGLLKNPTTNTGLDSELSVVFSTPLSVRSNQPVFAGDTVSLRRKTATQGAQRWEIDAMIVPTNDSNNFLVHSVTYGHHAVFGIRMPQTPKVALSNNVALVNATFTEGAIDIEVWWELGGRLEVGEFINFGDDPKVYLVIESESDPVEAQYNTFKIFPPLRAAIGGGDVVRHGPQVTMQAKFDTDSTIGMTFVDGILMDPGTIKLIEAINANWSVP